MPKNLSPGVAMLTMTLLLITGCADSRDERFRQLAQQSLMGSLVGQTEQRTRDALKIADAMAPCILFCDEIEKALSGVGSSSQTDSGVSARLFGSLLTWLNDQLDELVEQAKQVVQGVEPQQLRDNQTLRQHVATQLSDVQSVLDGRAPPAGWSVDRPRRNILRRAK